MCSKKKLVIVNKGMDFIHFFITGNFDTSQVASLDTIIRDNSITFTIWASILLIILTVISALIKKQNHIVKVILFTSMIAIISLNTLYLAVSTIYKNERSITKGPVHWHADMEVWDCGKEKDLIDPVGWSNKIGTPVLHEHNDKRMHVEGVVLTDDYASLGNFFNVIGGRITQYELTYPAVDGTIARAHGDDCNGAPGMVQVFVYKTEGDTFKQEKLLNPEDYILSGDSGVPPGDCIIVEFDSTIKDKTDKLCQSYKVQEQLGKIKEDR